jgi:hypothetical protein
LIIIPSEIERNKGAGTTKIPKAAGARLRGRPKFGKHILRRVDTPGQDTNMADWRANTAASLTIFCEYTSVVRHEGE